MKNNYTSSNLARPRPIPSTERAGQAKRIVAARPRLFQSFNSVFVRFSVWRSLCRLFAALGRNAKAFLVPFTTLIEGGIP